MSISDAALLAARLVVSPYGVLFDKIAEVAANSVDASSKASTTELGQLKIDAERQELQMRMAEAQARVAQELAIAKRIEVAEGVVMGEFYDYSGEASLGLKADKQSVSLGAGASGRRVSKRIYRFKSKASNIASPGDPS